MLRVYRIPTIWRNLAAAVIFPLVLGLGYLDLSVLSDNNFTETDRLFFLLMGLGIGSFLGYVLAYALRWRVEVWPDRVREVGLFRVREMELDQIQGIRIWWNHYTRHLEFVSFGAKPSRLEIRLIMGNAREFAAWAAAAFADLDQKESQAVLMEVLQDKSLGGNEEQRLRTFTRAQKWSRLLIGISLGIAVPAMFYPRPYLFVMWALIVVPVLAIVSIRLFRGALTLESKSAARLTIMIPLLLCDLALVVRSMSDFPILKWQPFWFPFLLITTILFVLLLLQSADVWSRWASALLALGLCLAYGFGATLTLNSILDSSAGLVYSARVISRRVHSGEYGSASYYLRLSPWGPQRRAEEVEVSKSTYVSHPEGDAVQILVKQGRFQIPWFYVR